MPNRTSCCLRNGRNYPLAQPRGLRQSGGTVAMCVGTGAGDPAFKRVRGRCPKGSGAHRPRSGRTRVLSRPKHPSKPLVLAVTSGTTVPGSAPPTAARPRGLAPLGRSPPQPGEQKLRPLGRQLPQQPVPPFQPGGGIAFPDRRRQATHASPEGPPPGHQARLVSQSVRLQGMPHRPPLRPS